MHVQWVGPNEAQTWPRHFLSWTTCWLPARWWSGDPLEDITILQDRGRLRAIVKDGAFYKEEL